ncbi:LysR family transcriptional regulator [Pokkaliibacter sp. MBI-7]|uniref:LysR family transcriptional regulator n=1 Tax=Pokkaliibacter sp. MBI-7 TaxID=3040600 RepID=UPI0024481E4B|nr:LysR family transcriptional regulator [Pokkaliibacter sp. MBI-7]MDH2434636.1 LysR family transcriptional regulator [Pokkaliibacter sp. MBI-7]
MDRFQEMQVLLTVVEQGSFARAAERLNTSAPSVTRAIAALEQRLGVVLLSRTTRSLRLTDAGQRYAADSRRILAELLEAEESAAGSHSTPRGQLLVTAPVLFGEQYVTPVLVDYLQQYPEVDIRALLVDRVVNMVDEGVEVAVRIGHLPEQDNAIRVGQVRRVVCAAPAYLQQYGYPRHPEDLHQARIVMPSSSGLFTEWCFIDQGVELPFQPSPRLVVTAIQAAINAAVAGWGITQVLSYQVASEVKSGALEVLLEDYEQPPLPIHVVYQGTRRNSAKVRSFVDFCVAHLRQQLAANTGVTALP